MLKRLLAFVGLVGLLVVPAVAQDRDANWREDLQYMAERLVDIHPDPYFHTPQAVFEQTVADLDAHIPELTDNRVMMELARIAALFEGHTYLFLLQPAAGFHLYNMRMYQFDDGLYVVQAEDKTFVGKRVVQIGSLTADEAYDRMSPYSSADNRYYLRLWVPTWLGSPEALHALGIIEDMNQPNYVLENENGEQEIFNPSVSVEGEHLHEIFGLPQQNNVLYLSNKTENFWQTYLADSGTLYVQYNHVYYSTPSGQTLAELVDAIEAVLAEQPVERVVVDLRHNGGGDNTTYGVLLRLLSQNEAINQPGKLFVIIGRQTFSAASDFANDLDKASEHVLFVGEPLGSRPNTFGDNSTMRLPNSGLTVGVAKYRISRGSDENDTRLWLAPDIPVPVLASDYFAGRDAALEMILRYTLPN